MAAVTPRTCKMPAVKSLIILAAAALTTVAFAAPPTLRDHGSTRELRVNDRPFLILGGELGNSSASSAEYMKPHWPRLKAMNLNTVLAPVSTMKATSWPLIVPLT